MTSLDRRSRSSRASRYLSCHIVTIISVVSSRSFLFLPGAVPRVPSRAKGTSKKKMAEDFLSENLSAVKHRRSSSFEEWIPIFNTSGSFLANFILYIYIYYKNICTIYIYTYIVYIMLYRAKLFPKRYCSSRHREQTCILIKEKRKRIENEKRSKVCYYFKKERIKSPLCCKKKK